MNNARWPMIKQLGTLLRMTRSHRIARRYFVVNGFDGALTMLGLILGFHVSENVDLSIVINVCLAAAIALGMSGLSSAYISEAAEKQKELRDLEAAMVSDLGDSAYGQAARLLPLVIALVNGMAPLVISLVIIAPLGIAHLFPIDMGIKPLDAALLVSLCAIFLLGVFIGRINNVFWLWAGLRTMLVAAVTTLLIFLLSPR